MKSSPRFLLLLATVSLLTPAAVGFASDLGTDNASNPAYVDANGNHVWPNGSGAVTGFSAWNQSTTGTGARGFFIGDSTTLSGGNSGANINRGGVSFGMYANTGDNPAANATRKFTGGALAVGQTFSLDLAVNYRNGAKGMDLQNADGNALFTFNVTGDDYKVQNTAATGAAGVSIGDAYSSNTSFTLAFTQTSESGGDWKITRNGGVTTTTTGTYTGSAAGFDLFINNTGQSDENNLFANNLAIIGVPEPATWLGGVFVAAAAGWRWRRPRTRRGLAAA